METLSLLVLEQASKEGYVTLNHVEQITFYVK